MTGEQGNVIPMLVACGVCRRPQSISRPPSLVIAKPRKGLWQSVSPVQTLRPSSPVPPRKLRGISRGPQPPGRWGGIPKGTAFGIGSLWRFLSPISFPLKEMGSPAGETLPSCSRPRRSGQSMGPLRIRRSPLRFVFLSRRLRRLAFFVRPKNVTKEMRSRGPVQGRSP